MLCELFINLVIGIAGSLVASLIFVWLHSRMNYRKKLIANCIEIIDILNKIQHNFNDLICESKEINNSPWRKFHNGDIPVAIPEIYWEYRIIRCEKIQYDIRSLYHTCLDKKIKKLVYEIKRNTAVNHLKSINSVFLENHSKYYGIVECLSDSINLLNAAKKICENYTIHKIEYQKFTSNQSKDLYVCDMQPYIEELGNIRKKILCHSEYIEKITSHIVK